jgi:hypothetical protein
MKEQLVDMRAIRDAYGLKQGERVKLKIPFDPKKTMATWSLGKILFLGHNHAYAEGGMPIGLVGMPHSVRTALVEHNEMLIGIPEQ